MLTQKTTLIRRVTATQKPLSLLAEETPGESPDVLTLEEKIAHSLAVLRLYEDKYDYWAISYSGGKDSTAMVTLICWAVKNGLVKAPKKLLILRSDTNQELPVLDEVANSFMQHLRDEGFDARTVKPNLRNRFYVQILGKGLLPVHPGQKGRWCTRSLKVDPMKRIIESIYEDNGHKNFLMLTGVRMGESAMRDAKLEKSLLKSTDVHIPTCSSGSGECGTGIWLESNLAKFYDALPLIIDWSICNVFDFLNGWGDLSQFTGNWKHGYEDYTRKVARMYGQHDDGSLEEDGSRFGCIGCPAVSRDKMLERVVKDTPQWAPLLELTQVWKEMRNPDFRHYHPVRYKMGPLTLEARPYFLDKIMDIQFRADIELISDEELAEIRQMWQEKVFPRYWKGNEPVGSPPVDKGGQLSFDIFNMQNEDLAS